MKAVILAAGIGSRLGELGRKVPKCLIEIGGKSLLERQIEILNSCGVKKEDIVVVIGTKGEVWTEDNRERIREIHHCLIINNENTSKNQNYSLWLALQTIDDSVLCIDGDTIFDEVIIKELLRRPEKSIFPFRNARKDDTRRKIATANDLVVRIAKDVVSEKVYTPIIKLSKDLVNAIKQELSSGLYFNETVEIVINKLCDKFEMHTLSLESLVNPSRPLILNINTSEEYNLAQRIFTI